MSLIEETRQLEPFNDHRFEALRRSRAWKGAGLWTCKCVATFTNPKAALHEVSQSLVDYSSVCMQIAIRSKISSILLFHRLPIAAKKVNPHKTYRTSFWNGGHIQNVQEMGATANARVRRTKIQEDEVPEFSP